MAKEKETEQPAQSISLADLVEALRGATPAQSGLSADELKAILESNTEATRKALKPENARHPDVSAFNPQGERDHPRPKLVRKTFWAGTELHEDELTIEEIELFNQVQHTVEARNGAWRAELKRTAADGTAELHVSFPSRNIDDRMDLPSMSLLMRELLGGTKAVDPVSLAQRVAELERQLSAHAT